MTRATLMEPLPVMAGRSDLFVGVDGYGARSSEIKSIHFEEVQFANPQRVKVFLVTSEERCSATTEKSEHYSVEFYLDHILFWVGWKI